MWRTAVREARTEAVAVIAGPPAGGRRMHTCGRLTLLAELVKLVTDVTGEAGCVVGAEACKLAGACVRMPQNPTRRSSPPG